MSVLDFEPNVEQTPATEAVEWRYASLAEWVEGWFLKVAFRYDKNQRAWCAQWWRHRYAAERLSTLWQAWEMMYPDPESASAWWVYHFDAHWPALTSTENGPFRACQTDHDGDAQHPLPHVSPPEKWPLAKTY